MSGIPFYRAREIGKLAEYDYVNNELFIDRSLYEEFSKSGVPVEGDLMVTAVGTLGKVYVVKKDEVFYYKDGSVLCLENRNGINPDYLKLAIESPFFIEQYQSESQGTTVATLTMVRMNEYIIPIPPIAEQQRIVAKLEEVLPVVDKYDKAQAELDSLNNNIKDLVKKAILQDAIQGKLVPQLDGEEPAFELLLRINKEKQNLLKQGKLKAKDITNSTIFRAADNRYYEKLGDSVIEVVSEYEFPNSWQIVRLSDICRLTDGTRKDGKHVCLDAKYLRGKSVGDYLDKGKFVTKGDNIILVDGENSGEVFSVPCDGYMGSTFKQLWVSSAMHLPYVLYFIMFYKDKLRNSKKGAAIPHLNKDIFYNLLIGVPPIEEQIRITEKVNILLSAINMGK